MKPPKELLDAEKRLEVAALDAFNAWLPEVLDAVLYGDAPIVAASGDKKLAISAAAAELARRNWAARADWILSAARNVWTEQYNAAKGLAERLIARRGAFSARVRTKLENIADEIFADLSRLINEGVSAGKTEAELADDIRERLDPANSRWANHAELIGRTEGPAAFNSGALEGHQQAPGASSQFKQWVSEEDGRVRPTHVAVTGIKVPLNGKFVVGGFAADHPGDESLPANEACNCRCWLRFGTASELGIVAAPDGKMDHMDERMEALVASIMAAIDSEYAESGRLPNGWRGVMAPLNRPTGDERQLNVPEGGVRTRQMPLTFRFQPSAIGGHDGAMMAGRIDYAWVEDGFVMGEGALDLNGEWGAEYARQLAEGFAQTLSVDPDEVTFEQQFFNAEGEQVPFNEAVIQGDGDPRLVDGYAVRDVMVDWRLAGVTAVQIPAFDEARIEPVYDYVPRVQGNVPDQSDSSMVALTPAYADSFAVEGGLPAHDLHVTLAYLGREADLSDATHEFAAKAAAKTADEHDGSSAVVAGYGVLGDKGANVLFLNGYCLDDAHNQVQFGMREAHDLAAQHRPFLAHMTLGYGLPEGTGAQFVGQEVSFATVAHHRGGDATHYVIGAKDDAVVATATGGTGFGVADRDTKWDGSKAGQAIFAHFKSGDGVDAAAVAKCFLYKDPNGDPQSVDSYKLPFVDIIGGTPKIVPNGVIGASGGHGVTATKGIPASEKSAIKAKICSLYAKIRTAVGEFPDCPFGAASLDEAVVASAAGGQIFALANFENPNLTGPTPLTVTEDGRVYGHVATWGACYMKFGEKANKPCVSVPFSNTDYARFKVHGAKMDDGSIMAVGAITFGDGHRTAGGLIPSQRLYAEVATIAAKVTCGEDEFGIWVSGEVVDAFRDRAYDLLLSPLSGHWEPDGDFNGALEMLAAHVVVAPGFMVPRLIASVGADGEYIAVQFAGVERGVSTEVAEELFAEAEAEGRITEVGLREDGAVIFSLDAPETRAAILADRKAQRAMLRMQIDPQTRAQAAIDRITKE